MVLVKEGKWWVLYSRKTRRRLGKFKTKKEALAQHRAIMASKAKRG